MMEITYLGDTYDEYNDINFNYKKKGYCKHYQFTITKELKTIILGKDLEIVMLRNSVVVEKINLNVFVKNAR